MRRTRGAALVALLLHLAPAPAYASTEGTKARAKELVVRGSEAFSGERFQEAGELFLEAYELLATGGLPLKPELLYNAAVAFKRIGDCERSAELLVRYRRAKPAEVSPNLSKTVEEVEACAPAIDIRTDPAGAEISVDGRKRGVAPLSLHLKKGAHRLDLELEGHVAIHESLEVSAPATVERALEAQAVEPPAPGSEPKVEPAPPPLVVPRPPVLEPRAPSAWPWIAGGTAAALAGAGAIFGWRASVEHDRYQAEVDKGDLCECRDLETLESARRNGRSYEAAEAVSFGLALASAGAALVIYLLDDPAAPAAAPASSAIRGLTLPW